MPSDLCVQDNKEHLGDGVFLYIVRLLSHEQDTSTQKLAADLLQPLMEDMPKILTDSQVAGGLHTIPQEWKALGQMEDAVNVDDMLQMIIVNNNIKVHIFSCMMR